MVTFLWLQVKLASCYLGIVLQYHTSSNFWKWPSCTLTNNKRHNFSCNEDNWTVYKVFGSWNNLLLLNIKVMLTSMYKCLVLVGQKKKTLRTFCYARLSLHQIMCTMTHMKQNSLKMNFNFLLIKKVYSLLGLNWNVMSCGLICRLTS